MLTNSGLRYTVNFEKLYYIKCSKRPRKTLEIYLTSHLIMQNIIIRLVTCRNDEDCPNGNVCSNAGTDSSKCGNDIHNTFCRT